jgi:GH15 family glucan-1,4-alpha-glucosidase
MPFKREYLPISDYGAIGNLRTVALVGIDGSIDWCCLPEIDSPSVFARLLDNSRGGRFSVAPAYPLGREQRYIPVTNVLETIFDTERGRLVVIDFMPLSGTLDRPEMHTAEPEICRLVRAEGGDVEVEVLWAPRFDYALTVPEIEATPNGYIAFAGDTRLVLGGLPEGEIAGGVDGRHVRSRFTLRAGESVGLATRWDDVDLPTSTAVVTGKLEQTIRSWLAWARNERQADDRSWAGYWSEHVVRSELALKLMTFAPTGAIAAAPTTSLPEWIGGMRNWDYRYSWIRDSGLAAQALNAMGHVAEAGAFIDWSERVAREWANSDAQMPIMYSVRGEHCLPERELTHLAGYRGSRPVRVGNEAAEQLQLDIFGELIGAAYEYVRMGKDFDPEIWQFLRHVADTAGTVWHEPDYGIWEVRSGKHHFTYSKMMVWVALQRACTMAARGNLPGDMQAWLTAQAAVREDVLTKGFNPEIGAFTAIYGENNLDAANLMIPLREFLPFDDPRVQGTIDKTLEQLTVDDLVYRYKMDDGLEGHEGAFVLCTFWMVDALALSGRLDEAYRIFDGLTARVNHVGLLSEQIDPETGLFLGNFPQAFSHIGLINSALYLAHMEGRETPVEAPMGTQEHRAEAAEALANPTPQASAEEAPSVRR